MALGLIKMERDFFDVVIDFLIFLILVGFACFLVFLFIHFLPNLSSRSSYQFEIDSVGSSDFAETDSYQIDSHGCVNFIGHAFLGDGEGAYHFCQYRIVVNK